MDDIDDYVRARWNDLVRTLVSLGAGISEAEQTAQAALARCWASWPAEQRAGDVDVLVYGVLLELWREQGKGRSLDDDDLARVLGSGAALTPHQVEDLVGPREVLSSPRAATSSAVEATAWHDLYDAPAPVAAIRHAVRRARRRRLAVRAGLLAAVLLVATVVVVTARSDDRMPPTPDPPPTRNAIPLAWWSADVLHLASVEVDTPGLLVLAQAGTDPTYSVVYGDSAGQVVQVEADGTSARIGTSDPGSAVLGSAAGLVTWIDLTSASPTLILWDTTSSQSVASLDLVGTRAGEDSRVVALDDATVYLRTATGQVETWRSGAGDTEPAAAGSPFSRPAAPRRELSPSGRQVATWEALAPRVSVGPFEQQGLATSLDVPGTEVVAARFVDDGRLVVVSTRIYLVGRDYDDGTFASGRFPVADLVTCRLETGVCSVSRSRVEDVDASAGGSRIVLAR